MKPVIDADLENLSEYETFVLDVWSSRRMDTTENEKLLSLFVMGIGLPGETSEVLEQVENYVFHPEEFDYNELALELGDVYYYLTRIGLKKGVSEKEIHDMNFRVTEATPIEVLEASGCPENEVKLTILKDGFDLIRSVGQLSELLKKEVRDNKLDLNVFKQKLANVHSSFHDLLDRFDFDFERIKDLNREKLIDRRLHGKNENKQENKIKYKR
jgi:hypothetical protein